eukprot:TRINITY_DN1898_c0_g2_i1.p1 TRINITY_DN1898_c0_g2~~TRINITY_DN1898_c0_g2_i1.p1  ORF type:complete len:668 (+),score=199.59 TRINITY_DN1898_c0_g2_i1:178-2181(+)
MGKPKKKTAAYVEEEKKRKEEEKKKYKEGGSLYSRAITWMFEEEDAAYIAFYRILWGLVMSYEMYLFMAHDFSKTKGSYFSSPYGWNCKYLWFEWVQRGTLFQMEALVISMFVAGIFIIVGYWYIYAQIWFFLGITYLFLIESSMYLNHMYLVSCICFVMLFLPCDCCYSLKTYWNPKARRDTIPKYYLFFIRALFIIVYTFAGIVKMNEDWLRAEPLRHWLNHRMYYPVPILNEFLKMESAAYVFSYGGMIYDFTVGFLFLFDSTFYLALLMTLGFHCTNKLVFNIGIFPWLMIASTTIFFDPDWPRRLLHYRSQNKKPKSKREKYKPNYNKKFTWKDTKKRCLKTITMKQHFIFFIIFAFLAVWLLFPLRHYVLYPGNVVWNEHGHKYSWRMKLRDKKTFGNMYVYHPYYKRAFEVPVADIANRRQANKCYNNPWMTIQFAHYIADLYRVDDHIPEVYAHIECKVNYRPLQPYTKHWVDLAKEDSWNAPYHWLTTLNPLNMTEFGNQYPWRFEWNFNWIRGKDIDNSWNTRLETLERQKLYIEYSVEHTETFKQFIAEKHFGGDVTKVGAIPVVEPDPRLRLSRSKNRKFHTTTPIYLPQLGTLPLNFDNHDYESDWRDYEQSMLRAEQARQRERGIPNYNQQPIFREGGSGEGRGFNPKNINIK